MLELIEKRTERSKTFDTGEVKRWDLREILGDPNAPVIETNGLKHHAYAGPVHFRNDRRTWEDIALDHEVLEDGTRSYQRVAGNCQVDVASDGRSYTFRKPNEKADTAASPAWSSKDHFIGLEGDTEFIVDRVSVRQQKVLESWDAARPAIKAKWSQSLTPKRAADGYGFIDSDGEVQFFLADPVAWEEANPRKCRRGTMLLDEETGDITLDIDLSGLKGRVVLDPSSNASDTYDWDAYANDASFSTARGKAAADTFSSAATICDIGAELFVAVYYVYRSGYYIDLSGWTSGTATAANLNGYCTVKHDDDGFSVYLVGASTWPNPASAGDWDAWSNNDWGHVAVSGFSTSAYNAIPFNSTALAALQSAQGSALKLTAIGSNDFSNSAPAGADWIRFQSASQANPPYVDITYTNPPTFTSITPSTGANYGTTSITNLAGSNFSNGSNAFELRPNGSGSTTKAATSVAYVNASKVTGDLDLTDVAPATYDVYYSDSGGSFTASNAFTVSQAAPHLTSLGTATITNDQSAFDPVINGHALGGATSAKLKKTGQTDVTGSLGSNTQTVLHATFDTRGIATGTWDVYVANATGNDTLAGSLTVTEGAPTFTSITPSTGANSNAALAITAIVGTHFVNVTSVKLKKASQTDITLSGISYSSTSIAGTANLQDAATGTWNVEITTATGTVTANNAFTITQGAPVPTSITPSSSPSDTVVSITNLAGHAMAGATSIKLQMAGQSDIVGSIATNTQTQITGSFDLTDAAEGYWDVVVTNGTGSGSLLATFRVHPGGPTITSTSPTTAPNDKVLHIKIIGTGMTGVYQAWLSRTGEDSIFSRDIVVDDDSNMVARFDIRGRTAASWTVNVRNTYGQASY